MHLIPVSPRLSVFLKLYAFLAAVTVLLLYFGISHAEFSTKSRLRAAELVSETFRDVKQTDVSVPCTKTCNAQLHCLVECTFQYTLLDEYKGTVTKRNCSSTGLSTTNASLATPVRWSCSFDYVVNEAAFDIKDSETIFRWRWVTWLSLILVVLDLAAAVLLRRVERAIADKYMAATSDLRRNGVLHEHEKLRMALTIATIFGFVLAGLYGSAALYGTTFQSFSAVDALYRFLISSILLISFLYLAVMEVLFIVLWNIRDT
ncbi:hypothetical protein AAVH_07406 [Aphelenchoides avenae]|nr:hypothetical protein AAVH_07406 [Aphelenchus avenae]